MKYERIVFVNPYPYYAVGVNDNTIYPPMGIATIAAYVEKYSGAKCKIIDALVYKQSNRSVLNEIKQFKADLVGIQLNVVTAKCGVELCKMIKRELNISIVLGGPFSTAQYEQLLKDTEANIVVRGEGEVTFTEIVEGKDWKRIDGIFFLDKNGKGVLNKPRELIKDIDEIPFPAYHLLPPLKLYNSRSRKKPLAPITSSRGCPYQCTFCNANIFGKRFRARSPENVVREIDMLVRDYGVRQIDVLDDNFTMDMERAEKILNLLISRPYKIAINLQNGVRADRLTWEMVKKMKKAGVYKAGFGVESGNEEVLKSIKKALDLRAVERAVKWFRKAGIISVGFFMLGFPSEDEAKLKETIDYAVKLNPSTANFSLVVPLPGTELYNEVKENNWFIESIDEGSDSGYFAGKFYYETPNLKQETILKYERLAYKNFHLRPSKIIETLISVRSVNEFKWLVKSGAPILKRLMMPNGANGSIA